MDWRRWHDEYEDPGSSLSRRLDVVRARLHEVLDRTTTGRPRLLSLCGGDGRDVVPVLAEHPEGRHVRGVVVELDEELAGRAQDSARAAGLAGLEVRCADAGDPGSFLDSVPTDVLLLCGIFGNIGRSAVRDLIERIPALVSADAHVIWTRGRGDGGDDPRDEVRRWFVDAGMPEISFDGAPETYGVGVNRVPRPATTSPGDDRLFTFVR